MPCRILSTVFATIFASIFATIFAPLVCTPRLHPICNPRPLVTKVEVKLRLGSRDDYDRLATVLASGAGPVYQQENYFFDGPASELNSKRVVVRVRLYNKDQKATLTIKVGARGLCVVVMHERGWLQVCGTTREGVGAFLWCMLFTRYIHFCTCMCARGGGCVCVTACTCACCPLQCSEPNTRRPNSSPTRAHVPQSTLENTTTHVPVLLLTSHRASKCSRMASAAPLKQRRPSAHLTPGASSKSPRPS